MKGSAKHKGSLISFRSCLGVSGVGHLAIIVKIMIYHRYLDIMKGAKHQNDFSTAN